MFTGAGLFYLVELIEDYQSTAKKWINYLIWVKSKTFLNFKHNDQFNLLKTKIVSR